MSLRIVGLSCLVSFFVIAILSVCSMLYDSNILFTSHKTVFDVATFIFYFLVECGLLHDGSTYLGYCILQSVIVVCSHHSHGLCCHSSYLNHCLGYCLHYRNLLSCHFRFPFYLLRNCFCETALNESSYFLLLIWSTSVCPG